jgi:hypothetical protein
MKRHPAVGGIVGGCIIVGLTLLFFWKIIFTNLILVGVDTLLYFYPYRSYVTQTLLAGRVPLWNPYLFLGAPLLANMQAAVLYPLNWLWLWLPVPRQMALSIVVHVAGAGLGSWAFARRSLKLSWGAAVTSGVIFGLGGFVGAQVEHINQLNVIAWLPWAFLLLDLSATGRRRLLAGLALSLVIALMLLAGHAQATYICLVGLALYALAGGSGGGQLNTWFTSLLQYLKGRLRYVAALAGAVALATLLGAVQLLPSLELSQLSVRSGGLPYREVISFSLRPWLLQFSLLPSFGQDLSQVFGEAYSEYVAYVGVTGLGLAAFAVWRMRPARRGDASAAAADGEASLVAGRFFVLLAALGLLLALGGVNPLYFVLYKIVPGFNLFRAPARWMALYAFGMAMLAGIGMQQLSSVGLRIPNARLRAAGARRLLAIGGPWVLLAAVCVELFVASRGLRYNQPTAPEAFSFWRPAIAHLKTDPGPQRFLSLSGIAYDTGDQPQMQAMLAGQLPDKAIYDYIVAAKEKEVLAYNLPLLYGLYSVDGYDGGLLPLRDFVTMQRLFLDEDRLSLDGRLREQLHDVPPGRLLSLLGVKYIVTDKVFDVWADGVYYDLQFSAHLSPSGVPRVEAADLPDFPATAVGVMSYLDGAADLPDGIPVARLTLADVTGWTRSFDLLAGRDTSEGQYQPGAAHQMARVGHDWRDNPAGHDYLALLRLVAPHRLTRIAVQGISPAGEFVLRGISLVNEPTNTSRQLTLSTDGSYRLVHSGDVKIYENLDVLPRAFVVQRAEVNPDDQQSIARLRDTAFDPSQTVILANGEGLAGAGTGRAEIAEYAPEHVVVRAASDAPGYLVLTDTYYPGWTATVDGLPAPMLRADVMFRAVRLEPGAHVVEFHYQPGSLRLGAWISALALGFWVVGAAWAVRRGR